MRVPAMVITPYAKHGYIDHQTLNFDAYDKFIEDDFLNGQRIDLRPTALLTRDQPSPRTRRRNVSKYATKVALRDQPWVTAPDSCSWSSVPFDA